MSKIKDAINEAAEELGKYAASEEAKGVLYVRGKLADIDAYLHGLWSKPVALGAVVIALLLGLLIGWSTNESRHYTATHAAAVEVAR